jgi:hypothetical protein
MLALGQDCFLPSPFQCIIHLNRRFTYGLHGVIAQKMTTFITTAVKTSNSTNPMGNSGFPYMNCMSLSFYLYASYNTFALKKVEGYFLSDVS